MGLPFEEAFEAVLFIQGKCDVLPITGLFLLERRGINPIEEVRTTAGLVRCLARPPLTA